MRGKGNGLVKNEVANVRRTVYHCFPSLITLSRLQYYGESDLGSWHLGYNPKGSRMSVMMPQYTANTKGYCGVPYETPDNWYTRRHAVDTWSEMRDIRRNNMGVEVGKHM